MQFASLTKEQLTATFGGVFSIVPSGPERRQAGGHYGTMHFKDGFFEKPVRRPSELAFYQAGLHTRTHHHRSLLPCSPLFPRHA